MAPRSTGRVTLLLGLSRIPVAVYPGAQDPPHVSFTTLCAEHATKAAQVFRCTADGKILDREKLAKGYEMGKDRFLVLTAEDLQALEPDPEIRIDAAFRLIDCDPRLWTGQVQYLQADVGDGPVTDLVAARDFARLSTRLEERGLVAVGRWSTRGCDRLVGIYSLENRLVLQGMRRSSEVRDVHEIAAAGEATSVGEVDAILKRITVTVLDTGAYPDERYDATVGMLAKKAEAAAGESEKPKRKKAAR